MADNLGYDSEYESLHHVVTYIESYPKIFAQYLAWQIICRYFDDNQTDLPNICQENIWKINHISDQYLATIFWANIPLLMQ